MPTSDVCHTMYTEAKWIVTCLKCALSALPLSSFFSRRPPQVQAALEALETVQHVQVRRCDQAGGLGGSGGWLGGCPYGKRNGFEWEVLFEPVYYVNERNTATGAYLPDHTGHKHVDEAPLSSRRSTNLGAVDPKEFEQGAAVEEARGLERSFCLSFIFRKPRFLV